MIHNIFKRAGFLTLHLKQFITFISGLISWLSHIICNEEEHPIYTDVCSNIAFLLLGINPAQLNQ